MLARLLVQFLLCSNSTFRADNQDDTVDDDEEEEEKDYDSSSQALLQVVDCDHEDHDKGEQHQHGFPSILKSMRATNHKHKNNNNDNNDNNDNNNNDNNNNNAVYQSRNGYMSPELLVDSSIADYLNRADWNHLALMNRHVYHHMVVVRITNTYTTNCATNTQTTRHSNLVPPPWPTWTSTRTIPTTMTAAAAAAAAAAITTTTTTTTATFNSNSNSTPAVILPVGILFYSMSLSSNEEWLACGCENGTIRFYNALYGPHQQPPPPPQHSEGIASSLPPLCSSFSSSFPSTVEPASSTTSTTSENNNKNNSNNNNHIPEPLTPSSPHQLRGHTNRVRKVLFSPTNPYLLVSSAQDGTVRIWWDIRPTSSTVSSSSPSSLLGDCVVSQSSSSSSSSSFASALAFTPNGQQLAIGQGSLATPSTNSTNTSTSTTTTTTIATGPRYPPSVSTIITIWDLKSQTCVHKWVAGDGQRSNFLSMAFFDTKSGSGQFLATSRTTRSNQVCVWDLRSSSSSSSSSFKHHSHRPVDKDGMRSTPPPPPPPPPIIHLEGDSRETLSLAWWDSSPSSSSSSSAQSPCSETGMQTSSSSSTSSLLLAAGSWYSTIKIWTIPNGQCIQTLGRQPPQPTSSRNGTPASSSSRPRRTTDSATWCLAFCPLGSSTTTFSTTTTLRQQTQRLLLLDGRGDGSIRFWNVQDGSCIQHWSHCHRGGIVDLIVTRPRNGHSSTIVSAGYEGTIAFHGTQSIVVAKESSDKKKDANIEDRKVAVDETCVESANPLL
jgi:WD40 repeat protein